MGNRKPDLKLSITIKYTCPIKNTPVELNDREAVETLIGWGHEGSDDGWYLSDSGINFDVFKCPACGRGHEDYVN